MTRVQLEGLSIEVEMIAEVTQIGTGTSFITLEKEAVVAPEIRFEKAFINSLNVHIHAHKLLVEVKPRVVAPRRLHPHSPERVSNQSFTEEATKLDSVVQRDMS